MMRMKKESRKIVGRGGSNMEKRKNVFHMPQLQQTVIETS